MLTERRAETMVRAAPEFPAHTMSPRLLLGPGPSMVHPRVLTAMASPLLGHLDPEFVVLMDRTQELLRYVFETGNRLTIPVTGTGSAAMEASIANTVEPGDPVLVCVNGTFGGRLADMAARYGGEVETITRPWGEVFDPAEIAAAHDRRPAKVVAIVHAETSTGALQPLGDLAPIVHDHGGLLVVDTVTSLSGAPVSVDANDIDVCYSGTQKCLSCPPGLGPITLGPRAVEKLHARKSAVRSWYLDLAMVEHYWGRSGRTTTPRRSR
jgi:alanine-glyoxylate transaminase / serine-glyoxylate transaminase / serine-pyruvate transaminase